MRASVPLLRSPAPRSAPCRLVPAWRARERSTLGVRGAMTAAVAAAVAVPDGWQRPRLASGASRCMLALARPRRPLAGGCCCLSCSRLLRLWQRLLACCCALLVCGLKASALWWRRAVAVSCSMTEAHTESVTGKQECNRGRNHGACGRVTGASERARRWAAHTFACRWQQQSQAPEILAQPYLSIATPAPAVRTSPI